MPRLVIRLKRLTPTHHEFAYVREDGSGEAVRLETRTLLVHDLLHFAVETEAGLHDSFYGMLASGRMLADLKADAMEMQAGEAAVTERAVGVLTGAIGSGVPADRVVLAWRRLEDAMGGPPPAWFDAAFVERVRERMRRLTGEWKATPFGESMTLTFVSCGSSALPSSD
jgi:hypothetical protein